MLPESDDTSLADNGQKREMGTLMAGLMGLFEPLLIIGMASLY